MRLTLSQRQSVVGFLFVSPWVLGFVLLLASPLLSSFILSFQKITRIRDFVGDWVGLSNYARAFTHDPEFIPVKLRESTTDLFLAVPVIMVFSLGAAYLLSRTILGARFFRAIFFLPVVLASGPVLKGLRFADVDSQIASFVASPTFIEVLFDMFTPEVAGFIVNAISQMTMILWRSGVQILLYLAGFKSISSSYYEAAKVDGATEWEMFWKITLPLITPIMFVNVIFTIVDSFTGPFNSTMSYIMWYIKGGYDGAKLLYDPGYGAALGWMYFLLIFIVILVVSVNFRKWVFYTGERAD